MKFSTREFYGLTNYIYMLRMRWTRVRYLPFFMKMARLMKLNSAWSLSNMAIIFIKLFNKLRSLTLYVGNLCYKDYSCNYCANFPSHLSTTSSTTNITLLFTYGNTTSNNKYNNLTFFVNFLYLIFCK